MQTHHITDTTKQTVGVSPSNWVDIPPRKDLRKQRQMYIFCAIIVFLSSVKCIVVFVQGYDAYILSVYVVYPPTTTTTKPPRSRDAAGFLTSNKSTDGGFSSEKIAHLVTRFVVFEGPMAFPGTYTCPLVSIHWRKYNDAAAKIFRF